MARRRNNPPEPLGPTVTPEVGITLMQRLVENGEKLLAVRPLTSASHRNWENTAKDYLTRTFGEISPHIGTVLNVGGGFTIGESDQYYEQLRFEELTEQVQAVRDLIEVLRFEIGLGNSVAVSDEDSARNEGVFLVHGSNHDVKETVARLLERIGLNTIVLHEQPNQGRTIIEKFVDYSQVGFAVVLLTADDRGGPKNLDSQEHRLRARQNVVLELGYFLGKLGRTRVCALYEDGVEIPSDYQGVIFLRLDEAARWKFDLAREIKVAGLPVDLNKVV